MKTFTIRISVEGLDNGVVMKLTEEDLRACRSSDVYAWDRFMHPAMVCIANMAGVEDAQLTDATH